MAVGIVEFAAAQSQSGCNTVYLVNALISLLVKSILSTKNSSTKNSVANNFLYQSDSYH